MKKLSKIFTVPNVIVGASFLTIALCIFAGWASVQSFTNPPPNEQVITGIASDKFMGQTVGGGEAFSAILSHDGKANIVVADAFIYAQVHDGTKVVAKWNGSNYQIVQILK